jgi:hypothetical protein
LENMYVGRDNGPMLIYHQNLLLTLL